MFYVSHMITTKEKPAVGTKKVKRSESKQTTMEKH